MEHFMKSKFHGIITASLAVLLLCCGPAWAHKVAAYAYAEGDRLMGEAYFAGGDKAMGCPVELYDAAGKLLLKGQTDAQGAFSLPLPQAAPPLKVVVLAGDGHRAEYEVTAEDLGQKADAATPAQPAVATQASPAASPQAAGAAAVDAAALEQALAKVLEQKLAPLRAQLSKMAADQPSQLTQIVGGLGWILGLVGVAAFFLGRGRR